MSWLIGGDERDRTADLLLARQALSQLSYTPTTERVLIIAEQIKSKRKIYCLEVYSGHLDLLPY
jgi:hypothetical protein